MKMNLKNENQLTIPVDRWSNEQKEMREADQIAHLWMALAFLRHKRVFRFQSESVLLFIGFFLKFTSSFPALFVTISSLISHWMILPTFSWRVKFWILLFNCWILVGLLFENLKITLMRWGDICPEPQPMSSTRGLNFVKSNTWKF